MIISPETFRAIVCGERQGPLSALTRGVLGLAEYPYRWVIAARNAWYDRRPSERTHRVGVPVVSVGNLTVGGTGKTPMVAWLAQWFRRCGIRVVLVSRGYGAKRGRANDEALELASRLPDVPHLQDPDRVAAARQAIKQHGAQLILLDDAFQHRRLARDLDVVLIDATEPFGYGHLLPRGQLREPRESLARADIIALTRSNLVDDVQRANIRHEALRLAPQATWLEFEQHAGTLLHADGQVTDLLPIRDLPLLAFCGIGNPAGFQKLLNAQGCDVCDLRILPDHFAYPPDALRDLNDWALTFPQAKAVVCTHKDWVKIPDKRIGDRPLYAITVDFRVTRGLAELEQRLHAVRS